MVKRHFASGGIHPLGPYVLHRDYVALQAENERLRAVVEELDRFRSMARWVSNCAGHGINSGMRAKGEELLVLINAAKAVQP